MKVAYIAGLGHSGSTLLDLMLSSHARVVSVGEIVFLRQYTTMSKPKNAIHRLGSECTCGAESVWECPFWTEVDTWLKANRDASLADLDLQVADPERYARDNRLLFEGVAGVSGAEVIVDSSKFANRLERLRSADIVDLRPIHLIRHPRATVYSHLRHNEHLRNLRGAAYMSLRSMRDTLSIRRSIRGLDASRIIYERFVREPESHLWSLMEWLGPGFEEEQLEWAGRERHNLGGNHMRRTTDSTIRIDEAWRTELRPAHALLVDLIMGPALIGARRERVGGSALG